MEFYLSTRYELSELEAVNELVLSGVTLEVARKEIGISYSPAWQFVTWSAKVADGSVDDHRGLPQDVINSTVARLRKEGQSWGDIATTICISESAVRRAYEQATNIQATGTRTGKGGRFWGDDEGQDLYANERQGTGVTVTPGTNLTTAKSAIMDPANMSIPLLKASIRALSDGDVKLPRKKEELVKLYASLTD